MNSAITSCLRVALPAALLLVVGSANAVAETVEVSIGSTARWMRSASIDSIAADDSNAAFTLSAGLKLNQISLPGIDLYVDANFDKSSFDGVAFERIDSETSITSYAVGVRAHHQLPYLGSRLSAFGRARLGAAKVSLRLSDALYRADPMHDEGWSGTAHLGGGMDLMVIPKGRLSKIALGLRAEAGYTAFAKQAFDAKPESDGDDGGVITIPTAAAPLGERDVSAWTFNFGVVGRF
jgi:hypothetical protein